MIVYFSLPYPKSQINVCFHLNGSIKSQYNCVKCECTAA